MAVDYSYSPEVVGDMGGFYGFLGAFFLIIFITSLAIGIFMLIVMWKLYKKAGKEGWEAIIPIYNVVVMFQIVGINPLWVIAMFIPVVNFFAGIVLGIITSFRLAKLFGKPTGFGFGILFLPFIFLAILAFGDAEFNGNTNTIPVEPAAATPVYEQPMPAQPVVEAPVQPVQPEVVTVVSQPVTSEVVAPVAPTPVDPNNLVSVVPTPPVINDPNNQNNV